MSLLWGSRLPQLVEHVTRSRGCEFTPHVGCRDHVIKKEKGKKECIYAILCGVHSTAANLSLLSLSFLIHSK